MELDPNNTIKTKRLALTPIQEKHIDDIHINFSKEVTRFMPFDPQGNKSDTVNFVTNSKKGLLKKTDIVFVVLDSNGEFMGCCGIHNINPKSVEVGLWLKEEVQSQGFGTEIIVNLIGFIEQNLKFEYYISGGRRKYQK